MRPALVLIALVAGACRDRPEAPASQPPPAREAKAVNGSISPAGDKHPGEIVHDDKVDKRVWTKRAEEVPPTIAWVRSDGKWIPVVRIEITGTRERREIAKFGAGGLFLETTVQGPGPKPVR